MERRQAAAPDFFLDVLAASSRFDLQLYSGVEHSLGYIPD